MSLTVILLPRLNTVFRKTGSFISGLFTGTSNKRKFDAIERAARDSQDLHHELEQLKKDVLANANQLAILETSLNNAVRNQHSQVSILVLQSRIQKIQDENRDLTMIIEAANSQLKDCESVIKRIKAGDGNTAMLLPNLNTPVNEEDAVDHQTANNANDLVYEGLLLDLNVPPPMENVANNGNHNVDNEDQMLQLANDIDVNDDIGNDHNDNVDNQADDSQDDMPPLEDAE
ncbi:unnamed protein product [Linum tenue]|uniref:Uncharacterized protein n=1 Tax=Linum tenue TaxID=586396 RepID=A0AAV0QB96_9ROSI|nr:unnamed protein product [Linum tenue]